jgi:hypothetical protein
MQAAVPSASRQDVQRGRGIPFSHRHTLALPGAIRGASIVQQLRKRAKPSLAASAAFFSSASSPPLGSKKPAALPESANVIVIGE